MIFHGYVSLPQGIPYSWKMGSIDEHMPIFFFSWLVVSNMWIIFHNIWDNPSHWLIFSEGLKPPTSFVWKFLKFAETQNVFHILGPSWGLECACHSVGKFTTNGMVTGWMERDGWLHGWWKSLVVASGNWSIEKGRICRWCNSYKHGDIYIRSIYKLYHKSYSTWWFIPRSVWVGFISLVINGLGFTYGLVGGLEHSLFSHILGNIPTD